MGAHDLLADAAGAGLTIAADGDRLVIRPASNVAEGSMREHLERSARAHAHEVSIGAPMIWRPGQPVLTASDEREWRCWRRESKRLAQRLRRAACPRVDYYPDKAAYAVILRCRGREGLGADYSTVINRIVAEWASEVPPE